jgi:hypothetical protein
MLQAAPVQASNPSGADVALLILGAAIAVIQALGLWVLSDVRGRITRLENIMLYPRRVELPARPARRKNGEAH